MTSGDGLPAERDLDIALAVASEINRVIAAADAKAGLLLAAEGVVLAGSAAGGAGAGPPFGYLRGAAVVLAAISVVLLVIALWPRTGGSSAWLAFPALNVGESPPDRPGLTQLADEAWAQAGTLAAIARRKYGWFRSALLVGAAGLLVFAGQLVSSALQ
ncbi:hypothetical protein [Pseudonocardia thermophila]|uniref:hypothetical protein n=1 Tax=Pseudonocardia thermophila TaxID=1848 RepID=UPI00248E4979|nr:hypothetical protein [Pseudonocardia thermophila]